MKRAENLRYTNSMQYYLQDAYLQLCVYRDASGGPTLSRRQYESLSTRGLSDTPEVRARIVRENDLLLLIALVRLLRYADPYILKQRLALFESAARRSFTLFCGDESHLRSGRSHRWIAGGVSHRHKIVSCRMSPHNPLQAIITIQAGSLQYHTSSGGSIRRGSQR